MSGKVLLAESAGFCYGVKRAVELARKTAEETGGCWMLGDLIHNTHVVEDLTARGIRKTEDPGSLGAGDTVVIRSHGEVKSVLDGLEAGASAASTPLAPMSAASRSWWPRRSRRDASPSSSASPTTRRWWAWPAGAAVPWCSTDLRQ